MLTKLVPWLFVAMWSTGYVGMKLGAPYAEPMTFLSIRFIAVLVLIVPAFYLMGVARLAWPDMLRALFIGAWLHGIYLGAVMWAIAQGMAAGIVALIITLQPIVTSVAAWLFMGEVIRPRHWFGLVLGFAGVAIAVFPGLDLHAPIASPAAILACMFALAAITFATLYQKAFAADLDLRASLIPQYVGAALVVSVMALLTESRDVTWTVELIFAIAWLVIVLSIGAVSLLLILLRHNAVWRTSALFYLVPPITSVFAWLMFDEKLVPVQVAGMGVVVVAVWLTHSARPDAKS